MSFIQSGSLRDLSRELREHKCITPQCSRIILNNLVELCNIIDHVYKPFDVFGLCEYPHDFNNEMKRYFKEIAKGVDRIALGKILGVSKQTISEKLLMSRNTRIDKMLELHDAVIDLKENDGKYLIRSSVIQGELYRAYKTFVMSESLTDIALELKVDKKFAKQQYSQFRTSLSFNTLEKVFQACHAIRLRRQALAA